MNGKILIILMLGLGLAVFAQAPYLLVVDASGSMDDTIPPDYTQTKMEAAKIAANDFIDQTNAEMGLIVFKDCDDSGNVQSGGIMLVQDFTTSKNALKSKIDALEPSGDTPIANALSEAKGYLKSSRGSGTIILITDGEETCDGDPVLEAGAIYNESIGKVYVIGYLIGGEAEQRAKQIAQAGGGKYYPVNSTIELKQALTDITGKESSPLCCLPTAIVLIVPVAVILSERENPRSSEVG